MDPQLLSSIQHRSAPAEADLSVIRARYALVRARTALVRAARGPTKSYGERIRGRNPKGFSPATSEALSPPLQVALAPLLSALEVITARIRDYDAQIEKLAEESYPENGVAQTGEGRGNDDRVDICAYLGRCKAISKEPGCWLFRWAAAR